MKPTNRSSIICFFIAICASFSSFSYPYTIEFSKQDFTFEKQDGFNRIKPKDASFIENTGPKYAGKPTLPFKLIHLIIPPDNDINSINFINVTNTSIEGNYILFPQQPINRNGSFVEPDSLIYNSALLYPSKCIEIKNIGYFDNVNRIVTLAIYPFQYNPAERKIVFNENISFSLSTTLGEKNNKRKYRTQRGQKEYTKILNSMVFNPEDIPIYSYHNPNMTISKIADESLQWYDFTIITSPSLASSCNTFVNWIKRNGLTCGVITTTQIYENDNYNSTFVLDGIGDNAEKIRNYLNEISDNATYALIVGTDEHVPVRYGTVYGVKVPSDLYYSDFDGDWNVDDDLDYGEDEDDAVDHYIDLIVGRIPCTSSTDVLNWVKKRLLYEQNPGNGLKCTPLSRPNICLNKV